MKKIIKIEDLIRAVDDNEWKTTLALFKKDFPYGEAKLVAAIFGYRCAREILNAWKPGAQLKLNFHFLNGNDL